MSLATDPAHAVAAELAFSRLEDVTVDDARRGLLRARTLDPATRVDPALYDRRTCRVCDCSVAGLQPDLRAHGFARVDLSDRGALQAALARVRVAGRLEASDAAAIRRSLLGRALALPGGERLWLLHLAREGFFMRRAGPNGMALDRGATQGMNDHDAAVAVHADQDVEGTPLRQILRGAAPWLFRHESPDRRNHRSRLVLVNVWIPLDQVTRPLALMDRGSLDRRRHQLRHGLVTDAFLRRGEDMRVNDIWTFLHDDAQRWYFASDMDASSAWVFETLGTPHGSFIVPGEERAEARYRQLVVAVAAVRRGDEDAAARSLADETGGDWRAPATPALARAIAAMESVLAEGRADVSALCRAPERSDWCARASAAAERVVRKSIEMRAVALILPAVWPFRR
ncbi:hypothetical protein [Nannocystis sp. SCPEA4]|uniref:hypothetical protein n=1 Tax=Nannocystis sp. SCPEA4 TaxID=2996787 RepID=UPI00227035AA|nr:hypothetical protein [Nannocystis sp. SCPEA4]MCY1059611.1 hypothetical protein [Nannocystis sp. SCPEA4]